MCRHWYVNWPGPRAHWNVMYISRTFLCSQLCCFFFTSLHSAPGFNSHFILAVFAVNRFFCCCTAFFPSNSQQNDFYYNWVFHLPANSSSYVLSKRFFCDRLGIYTPKESKYLFFVTIITKNWLAFYPILLLFTAQFMWSNIYMEWKRKKREIEIRKKLHQTRTVSDVIVQLVTHLSAFLSY